MKDLQSIDIDKNTTVSSFDISNMYTNIPQKSRLLLT
jgi:hypothetical protein